MLVQLEARGFRNLEPLQKELGQGLHLILGDNGAGKTSLLEAIYLLATTRSFRTSQLADCCRHGAPGFTLAGDVESDRRTRLEVAWTPGERQRAVNGKRTSLVEHLAVLPVICWTAESLAVLTGSPADRRRFLDRGVVGSRPAALAVLGRYRRALGEKRQLLLSGRGGEALGAWNRVLAEAATELIRLRRAYVEALQARLAEVLAEADLGWPAVELHYRSSPRHGCEGVHELERELEAVAERERQLRQPLRGPHRDELEIRWNERLARRVASAGERKALGLLLLAAQGRVLADTGQTPIYLLDDVDTELDAGRLTALWHVFHDARQLFATSNRPQVWDKVAVEHRWQCRIGRFTAAPDRPLHGRPDRPFLGGG